MQSKKQSNFKSQFFISFISFKLYLWVIFSSSILFIGIYFFLFRIDDLNVFPKNNNLKIEVFTDSIVGGKSQLKHFNVSKNTIDFAFILKEGFINPYMGINIFQKNDHTIDLSPYNQFQFEIKGQELKNIIVVIITQNKNQETNSNKNLNELYFTGNLEVTPDKRQYCINLNQFKIPDWWYELNKLSPSKKLYPDLKHVLRINIANGSSSINDNVRSLQISSISFVRNNTSLIFLFILTEIVIIILLFVFHYIRTFSSKKSTNSVTITYKPLQIDKENNSTDNFLNYINNNFLNNNLSLETVSAETGINQRRIANSIFQQFGCNFKTYINQIRVNEAKRLLSETDLSIGEIAFKVGFNSPNHFNRVFKSMVELSPSDFKDHK